MQVHQVCIVLHETVSEKVCYTHVYLINLKYIKFMMYASCILFSFAGNTSFVYNFIVPGKVLIAITVLNITHTNGTTRVHHF